MWTNEYTLANSNKMLFIPIRRCSYYGIFRNYCSLSDCYS